MEASARSEQDLRKLALARLRKKRDFVTHAVIYVVVNVLLVVIWALLGGGFFWPGFVIAGWGIGLAANAWDVYGRKPITEDQVQQEAERLRAEGADR
jgi:hypothetical protein